MRATIAAILIPLSIAPFHQIPAQSTGTAAASSRTAQLVAMFSKNKHVVKEKRGVRVEKYKDVRSEPALRAKPTSYSGTYDTGMGFVVTLRVDSDGRVEGSGHEPVGETNLSRTFTIRDARIDGALLTGSMVFRDGHREKLEGVFMNRTSRESPSDRGTTMFGLGLLTTPKYVHGSTIERLFYERASP